MKPPPPWAQDLVIQVALDADRDDVPELVWRGSRAKPYSTGQTQYCRAPDGRVVAAHRIVVTAGIDPADHRFVLLHELAHWLLPHGEHHGPRFYERAWRLYRHHGVDLRLALEREAAYRKTSVTAYYRTRSVPRRLTVDLDARASRCQASCGKCQRGGTR